MSGTDWIDKDSFHPFFLGDVGAVPSAKAALMAEVVESAGGALPGEVAEQGKHEDLQKALAFDAGTLRFTTTWTTHLCHTASHFSLLTVRFSVVQDHGKSTSAPATY